MLKKLIKHEFKATYRFYLPIYIGLAGLIALACAYIKITEHFDVNELFLSITMPLGTVVGVLAIIFTLISPYIFVCLRFYRSTATREGYLTFTLPASTNQILFSKFLVSFIWAILTVTVTILALLVLVTIGFDAEITFTAIREVLKSDSFNVTAIFSFFVGYVNSILAIYAAISLGQFVRDHRVIASIAFYAAIYTVQQIASLIVLIPFIIRFGSLSNPEAVNSDMGLLTGISIVLSLVFSAIFYFISNRILERKLNLP
ncbi:MAG: hypothetical protein ACI4SQ_03030 [Eubacterium sp.]